MVNKMAERWKKGIVRIISHDGTSIRVPLRASSWGRVADERGGSSYGTLQPFAGNASTGYRKIGRRGATFNVNRVVCSLFHGPPPGPLYQCDHIDSNRSNNMASNLRWILPRANVQRAVGVAVQGVDPEGEVQVDAGSLEEAHELWPEATAAAISECVNGDRKSAGGLKWLSKK